MLSQKARRLFLRLLVALRGRAVAVVGVAVALAPLAIPASAAAHPAAPETISISWAVTSPPPTSPPFRGTGGGTFTATGVVTDSGTLAGAVQDVAVPSPNHGTNQLDFTLTGNAGTLNLRCKQTETNFSDPTAIPGTGPCTITGGGTGVYADVQGHGTMSGIINGFTRSQTATIDLSIV
jgi:hypothetical protein